VGVFWFYGYLWSEKMNLKILDTHGDVIETISKDKVFQPVILRERPLKAFMYTQLPDELWNNQTDIYIEGYKFKDLNIDSSFCDVYLYQLYVEGSYSEVNHIGYAQLEDVKKFFGIER